MNKRVDVCVDTCRNTTTNIDEKEGEGHYREAVTSSLELSLSNDLSLTL